MPSYIYTVKDRCTGEILCSGNPGACAAVIGCDQKYVWVLSEKGTRPVPDSKYSRFVVERTWDEKAAAMHGGKRTRDIECLDCGTPLENVSAKRKRCPECAEKWRKEYNRQKQRERRNLSKEACKLLDLDREQTETQEACAGCIYFYGRSTLAMTCNYIFCEGHSRGCPPGNPAESLCGQKEQMRGVRPA